MWENPPQKLILNNNDVHIWLLDINEFLSENIVSYFDILSSDEQEKFNTFSRKLQGHRFLINRAYLRIILAQYLQISPQEILFNYSQKGKPSLNIKTNPEKIYFNVSHKYNYTIYAIARKNLGIDLEKIDPQVNIQKIAQRFFCLEEYECLKQLNSQDKAKYFFTLWTIKEAYLKSIGEGLSGGLNSIYINLLQQKLNYQLINYQEKKKLIAILKHGIYLKTI
ncbi:4'-phosphopantetheinyl transferase superfamily protein [Geminocystis sp. NIES-3709]|uniref:4'-phosphopantetheinyl transferase family protein n=1 Tax=Geminocystis sp. NIES-3709 TaxID=1617448 RepID=UPI0005FC7532|nr:4'-phosphopantetheinyl transferase superfamily protein [Geminocystis sp. NIES-3709]BAQ63885.1 4'-phosphopantetheinyl transferase [Geminocystis sp. NIES-3709]